VSSPPFPGILTVREHAAVEISSNGSATSLSSAEVSALEQIAVKRPDFLQRYATKVVFGHYGGIVAMDQRILEILPKIDSTSSEVADRSTLLRMLRVARMLPAYTAQGASHNLRHAHLLDAFVQAFLNSVFAIVRGGLLRQYLHEEDDLKVVRGRIDLRRQLSINWNRQDRIACKFDELTVDNRWNRVLKLAITLVRPWIASMDLFRRCVELSVLFDEVRLVSASDALSYSLRSHRQASRYRTAIEWAMAIIRLLAPSLRAGQHAAPALLYDLNKLFESAIAVYLEGRLPPGYALQAQAWGKPFGKLVDQPASTFATLRPDLVLRRRGEVIAIGDTKWKVPDAPSGYITPNPGDLYQMYAYAAGFNCDVTLIYPWQSNLKNARATVIELPETGGFKPRLHMVCVDVTCDPFRLVVGNRNSGFGQFIDTAPELAA
jgi:5-methylcytosine-specific restriction enzyme subunit McrC